MFLELILGSLWFIGGPIAGLLALPFYFLYGIITGNWR